MLLLRFDGAGRRRLTASPLPHRERFLGGKLLPTKQEGKGVPAPDDEGRGAKLVRTLTLADFPKTGVHIDEKTWELSGGPK